MPSIFNGKKNDQGIYMQVSFISVLGKMMET